MNADERRGFQDSWRVWQYCLLIIVPEVYQIKVIVGVVLWFLMVF